MKIIVGTTLSAQSLSRIGVWDNRLAYVLGLQALGHEVYLMGDLAEGKCRDPHRNRVSFEYWHGRKRFEELARQYAIWPRCCMIYNGGEATHGMNFPDAVRVAKSADLLINIAGKLWTPAVTEPIRCRIYVDLDPLKTQVKDVGASDKLALEEHHHFFTVGLNLGRESCAVPTDDLNWRPLFHPVCLAEWSPTGTAEGECFTSVTSWKRSFMDFQGRRDIGKGSGWARFADLPTRTEQAMELLVDCAPGSESDLARFAALGWRIGDATGRLLSRQAYLDYLRGSRAEFSVARTSYVDFHTGWVSDRTARYLALGKPVLVQATGIEEHLPVGQGFLTYRTMDEALIGIDNINRSYREHASAARRIAEEYFDASVVLGRLLQEIGL